MLSDVFCTSRPDNTQIYIYRNTHLSLSYLRFIRETSGHHVLSAWLHLERDEVIERMTMFGIECIVRCTCRRETNTYTQKRMFDDELESEAKQSDDEVEGRSSRCSMRSPANRSINALLRSAFVQRLHECRTINVDGLSHRRGVILTKPLRLFESSQCSSIRERNQLALCQLLLECTRSLVCMTHTNSSWPRHYLYLSLLLHLPDGDSNPCARAMSLKTREQ